jgi:glucose/arabinose dehydrogenase
MRIVNALMLLMPLTGCAAERVALETLQLPEGFGIELYADDVPGARSLALGDEGTVFVSTRNEGRVYALRDGQRYVLVEDMNRPNGVAFRDGDLFIAEVDRVWRLRDIERNLDNPPEPELVSDAYPSDRHHGWKFIAFGPDGWLYVPIGAPCNICDEDGYARITRLDVGTGEVQVHAQGVRNTVGFDWHPETGALWFTDNGRDWLGDDLPPDELNHAPEPGMHFGYPYCHGEDIVDPEFGGPDCSQFTPPAQALGPHVAALGMRFYTGSMFPPEYRGQIFIAEHGSWNRSRKIGYRVTLVRLDGDNVISYEPFITGWLGPDENAWGRPVDLMLLPDGSMLLSDDHAGVVYRIFWTGESS